MRLDTAVAQGTIYAHNFFKDNKKIILEKEPKQKCAVAMVRSL
jgi:hypothetical protein